MGHHDPQPPQLGDVTAGNRGPNASLEISTTEVPKVNKLGARPPCKRLEAHQFSPWELGGFQCFWETDRIAESCRGTTGSLATTQALAATGLSMGQYSKARLMLYCWRRRHSTEGCRHLRVPTALTRRVPCSTHYTGTHRIEKEGKKEDRRTQAALLRGLSRLFRSATVPC